MSTAGQFGIASTHVPVRLTSLIGRERELADVRRLLSAARLVTITGAGGVGKTSLAVQVARELHPTFTDGASFISLGAIRDPTLIIPTIAHAVGLAESPDRLLLDSLKAFLGERHMLLLLDNFEQVISAAPLLTELLAACARLQMLVTSRETLRLYGEQEFPLAPLAVSSRAAMREQLSVETLLQYPGIALFVQRAQASQPEFKLTGVNAAAVADVCASLDGLPLAIELAAARIKLLPPQAMLARLQESSLSLLTGGARDLPVRQQTLRATLQWSYDLLNADEQRAIRYLAVFVGGFTLEAATHLIGDDALIVLERVTALINKSLLQQSEGDGEPRVSMLETVREFGLEQLAHENELEAAQRVHAECFLALAEATEQHLTGRTQKAWLKRLGREQDNVRAALRWGVEHRDAGFVLRLVAALWQPWSLRGQWSEGRRWLEEALSMASKAEIDQALLAKALYGAATLIRYQADFARARALCEQSVSLYRALGDREGLVTALLYLCRILDYQADDATLRAILPEMFTLADELPDVPIKAHVYAYSAVMSPVGMDSETVARYVAESERIFRALDHPAGLALALFLQAGLAGSEGDEVRAKHLRDAAERLAAEVEDQHLRLGILSGGMVSAWKSGDDASARRYFEQLVASGRVLDASTQRRPFFSGGGNVFLWMLAAVLHRQGLSVWAARVYGLADTLAATGEARRLGGATIEPLKKRAAVARADVRTRLGEAAFDRAFAEGRALTIEELRAIPQPAPTGVTSQAAASPASGAYELLTAREMEVLHLLAQDLSTPQIAERLVLSRRTVEAHLQSVYGKLGVKSRDAAVRVAIEHTLLEPRHRVRKPNQS
jgi:predicted ATPase/DNA-binding CsgD family transcriptional regulator